MSTKPRTQSRLVVYAALGGNLVTATVKFGAAAFTGSSAMLSEAVHSLVDTGNQALLLIGLRQAERRPTAGHPFGHGLLLYFWSFIVAIMIFGAGAGVSVLEGIGKLRSGQPVTDVWVNYVVLGLGVVIEGTTLAISLREFQRSKGRRGWFDALQHSKDPSVFTVILEDSAALIGLLVAFLGLLLAQLLDSPAFDGVASIMVGLLLASAAWFLARECHGLLSGEAAAPEVLENVRRLVQPSGVKRVNDILSMHFGPRDVLLAISLELNGSLTADMAQDLVTQIERDVQASHPEMTRVFIEIQRAKQHREAMTAIMSPE